MIRRRIGLGILLVGVGCGSFSLAPSTRMWVPTRAQNVQLHVAQTECDRSSQRSSGSIDTTLSIWIDEAEFERCMKRDGWVLDSIRGVSPISRVRRYVNVRSEPSPKSPVLAQLSRGKRAGFLTEIEGWYQVRLDDGSEGYVSSKWTELVGSRQ